MAQSFPSPFAFPFLSDIAKRGPAPPRPVEVAEDEVGSTATGDRNHKGRAEAAASRLASASHQFLV